MTRQRTLADHKEEVLRLYLREEMSTLQVGASLGFSHNSVGKFLKRHGVVLRGPGLVGAKNPHFVDGQSSIRYRKMVALVACTKCGSTKNLGRHHMDGNHANNTIKNLEVLCATCHAKHHWDTDRARERLGAMCKRGHDLAQQKRVKDGKGYGGCRECHKIRVAAYKKRKKLAAKELI